VRYSSSLLSLRKSVLSMSHHSTSVDILLLFASELILTFIATITYLGITIWLAKPEFSRRAKSLYLSISKTTVEPFTTDDESKTGYFLLKVVAYNHSSSPKTIFKWNCRATRGSKVHKILPIYDDSEKVAIFSSGSRAPHREVPLDEVLSDPLDVDPLHTRTFYVGVTLAPITMDKPPKVSRQSKLVRHQASSRRSRLVFWIDVLGEDDKPLAQAPFYFQHESSD